MLALAPLLGPAAAGAQGTNYPSRPIRLIVGFAPGGSTDAAARTVGPKLSEILAQPVVVENRPGAGGNIATEAVVRAAPDGHTLLLGTIGPLIVNPVMYPDLGFNPTTGLVPVALMVDAFGILVVPAARAWRSVADLIAEARRRPRELNWGYSGVGTSGHLAGLLLDSKAAIETEGVPYRGGGQLMTDLLAGRLDYAFATAPTALPNVESGKLRALAVPTAQRSRLLPEVPTIAEAGVPGYDASNSYGLLAPRGTPPAVIEKAAMALRTALEAPDVIAALARQGFEAKPSSPGEFADFLRAESARWEPIIRANGLQPS
jgi:tripartite-type tricarboxylate transporter receptor subunit TctC